ncbi:ribonuclease III [Telmatospirillum sp.]|uniref:ribonuclease III n=1 Tax=Telmatospirillum sp. TaxID=2079197 RepID=UPI00285183DF|nr:ribonuclease III [Telmatospirillum sp.]MDR3440809.1 ribonuclease III [Telmatospirillum sp.]
MDLRLINICRALDYQFRRPEFLEEALMHSSACTARGRGAASSKPRTSNERLEFLGDRVLGLTVAEMLFFHFNKENEGALARRHAALVRREALARVAITLGLDDALVMSKGEEDGGGRQNPTILADACEAILGAVYADGGLDVARTIVRRHWEPLMAESITPPKDAKTGLQEWAQGRGKPLPVYETLGAEGPQHDPIFLVSVSVEGFAPLTGRGASKRVAEQAAASAMLEKVTK